MKLPPPPRLTGVVVIVILVVMLAACGPKGGNGQAQGGGMPPAVVAVQEVKPRTVPVEFEFPAQTAGSREVEVRARVSGILLKRNFEEGEPVRAGQSLYSLDDAPFEAAAARAEADVTVAEARLAQARRNAARMKPLFEAKAASQKDFDDAASAEEVANAEVKSARARLAESRLNLGYTKVVAPVSGVTSRSLKSEGSLIPGPDALLTTVSQVDPIHVNFGLSESEQSRIKSDAAAGKLVLPKDNRFEVAIRFEDGTTFARSGRLAFTDARVNTLTGTSDARAEIPNPGGQVRPGQFVRVILKGAHRPDALTVPQRAVMEGPQGKLVYLVGPDNKAVPKAVTVGEWVAGNDWIITAGLNPGDKVIVDGLMKVFPGAQVQVGPPEGGPVTPAQAGAPSPEKTK